MGIDGDALAADDVRHTVLTLRKNVRALLIDRLPFGAATALDRLAAGQWIARALAPTSPSGALAPGTRLSVRGDAGGRDPGRLEDPASSAQDLTVAHVHDPARHRRGLAA